MHHDRQPIQVKKLLWKIAFHPVSDSCSNDYGKIHGIIEGFLFKKNVDSYEAIHVFCFCYIKSLDN